MCVTAVTIADVRGTRTHVPPRAPSGRLLLVARRKSYGLAERMSSLAAAPIHVETNSLTSGRKVPSNPGGTSMVEQGCATEVGARDAAGRHSSHMHRRSAQPCSGSTLIPDGPVCGLCHGTSGLFRANWWLNRIRPLSSNLKSTWRIVVMCQYARAEAGRGRSRHAGACAPGRERACQSRCRTESWAAGGAAGLGATAMRCRVTGSRGDLGHDPRFGLFARARRHGPMALSAPEPRSPLDAT